MEDLTIAVISIVVFIALIFSIAFVAYVVDVNIIEANIVSVYDEDTLLYHGKMAFVSIETGGMTTTITIYSKLFPFGVKDKVISSKNIRVE